ncbi:MAG: SCO6745 family protein [Ilumatobacteraceae bacterium]
MTESPSRRLWKAAETVHAVTYFSEESIAAARELGYRGFWMGYFAFRAAPLGPVGPAAVEALFNNFHADRVARALPDAWEIAPPSVAIDRRRSAAAEALRRFGVEGPDEYLMQAMFGSVATIAPHGRAMFAANRQIAPTGDPVADLWQWCTTVREHRGDGHVAALAVLGIDGLEATVLLAADLGIDFELFEQSRGWERRHIDAALSRLGQHGLVDEDGGLTESGRSLRQEIEDLTDRQAFGVLSRLGEAHELVLAHLEGAAEAIRSAGAIPYPNPIGLDPR